MTKLRTIDRTLTAVMAERDSLKSQSKKELIEIKKELDEILCEFSNLWGDFQDGIRDFIDRYNKLEMRVTDMLIEKAQTELKE